VVLSDRPIFRLVTTLLLVAGLLYCPCSARASATPQPTPPAQDHGCCGMNAKPAEPATPTHHHPAGSNECQHCATKQVASADQPDSPLSLLKHTPAAVLPVLAWDTSALVLPATALSGASPTLLFATPPPLRVVVCSFLN
jgi:hypothetical protein